MQDGFHEMLRFRAWNEHGGRDEQVHPPEFLMAGDVLSGNAADALRQRGVELRRFVFRQNTLGMGEEMRAITTERKHQKRLSG